MGDLFLRSVDERVMQSLQRRAARAGRSVDEECGAILEDVTQREARPQVDREALIEELDRFRASLPRMPDDSTDIIRELRDGRSFG